MPVYVYILQSESTGRFYVGHTQDVQERVQRHNDWEPNPHVGEGHGGCFAARSREGRAEAMRRERELKGKHRRIALEALVRLPGTGSG